MLYMTSMRKFIVEHRKEIDEAILRANPRQNICNDHERELWILNDEGLYNWTKRNGVKV